MGKQLNDVELWNEYLSKSRPVELRNKLAEKNLALIYEVIAKTKRTTPALNNEDMDDLFQQGFFGLNSAIERFEMGEGRYFYAFAFPFIYGRLMSWMRDKSRMIRVPVIKHDLIMRCFKIKDRLKKQGVNSPTFRQIFELVPDNDKAIGFEKWKDTVQTWHRTWSYSIDGYKEDEEGNRVEDRIPSKDYQSLSLPTVNVEDPCSIYPELSSIFRRLAKKRCFIREEQPTKNQRQVKHFSPD